jgi:hypothetical protein
MKIENIPNLTLYYNKKLIKIIVYYLVIIHKISIYHNQLSKINIKTKKEDIIKALKTAHQLNKTIFSLVKNRILNYLK